MKYLKCLQDCGSVNYQGGLVHVGTLSVMLDTRSLVHRSIIKSHIDILVLQVKTVSVFKIRTCNGDNIFSY